MSKFPLVEYDTVSGLVNGDTAKQIYRFLADEADMEGRALEAAMYRAKADSCEAVPPAGIKDNAITEAIAKWGRA